MIGRLFRGLPVAARKQHPMYFSYILHTYFVIYIYIPLFLPRVYIAYWVQPGGFSDFAYSRCAVALSAVDNIYILLLIVWTLPRFEPGASGCLDFGVPVARGARQYTMHTIYYYIRAVRLICGNARLCVKRGT